MNTVSHIEDDSKIRKTYSQLDLKALIKHTVRSDGWSVTKGFQPETKQLWFGASAARIFRPRYRTPMT